MKTTVVRTSMPMFVASFPRPAPSLFANKTEFIFQGSFDPFMSHEKKNAPCFFSTSSFFLHKLSNQYENYNDDSTLEFSFSGFDVDFRRNV